MRSLLLVEDDRHFASVLKDYLTWLGFRVVVAEDGAAGWDAFSREPPDVVVCDVLLPRLDGGELCRRIRSSAHAPPVLLMSAVHKDPGSVAALRTRTGASGWLAKPFPLERLRDWLEQTLPGVSPLDDSDQGPGGDVRVRRRPGEALPASGVVSAGFLAPLMLRIRGAAHTGVLTFKDESRWKRILFQAGRPIWADGGGSHDRMGTMLLEEGTISQAQYAAAVAAMKERGLDFGHALTTLGILSHAELYEQLRRLVERRVVSAFGWSFGEWTLSQELPRQTTAFDVPALALVWRGIRAHGNLRVYRDRLAPLLDGYVVPTERFVSDFADLRREDGIGFLGSFLGGRRTARDLSMMEILPEGDLIRALWLLLEAGLVAFSTAARDGDAPTVATLEPVAGVSLTGIGERIIRDWLRYWQLDAYSIFGLDTTAGEDDIVAALQRWPLDWSAAELPEELPPSLRRKAASLEAWLQEARATLADPERRKGYLERVAEGLTGVYRNAGGTDDAEAAMFFEMGREFVQTREFREAEESFRRAADRAPRTAEYAAYQGWAAWRRGGAQADAEVDRLLQRALDVDPHLAIAHYFRGMVLRDRRHHDEAVEAFEKALRYDPRLEAAATALQQTRELAARGR